MTTGFGPCREEDFDDFLRECGVEVFAPGADGPGVLIVGQEDWDDVAIEAALEARVGIGLRVYSQEMVFSSLMLGDDVYSCLDQDAIRAFGEDHVALDHLSRDMMFDWPTTDILPRDNRITVNFGAFGSPETGLLRHLGYSVGQKGLSVAERRAILDRLMSLQLMPASDADRLYLDQWGLPSSADRLQKTANCLAAFARLKKQATGKDYSAAIADWEADLNYLYDKYYTSLATKVHWPRTSGSA